jgi:hypothetical protein
MLGDAIGMRGPEARAAAVSGGQSALVAPAISPADIDRANVLENRLYNVGAGPSWLEKTIHLIGGSSEAYDVENRTNAAAMFRDPHAQELFRTNPDALKAAELDPVRYSQSPGFLNYMKAAQDHYNNLMINGAVHDDGKGPPIVVPPDQINDHVSVSKIKAHEPEATDMRAVAATQPGHFTDEEFARIFDGMSVRAFAQLFGPALTHAATMSPQESVQRSYLSGMQAKYDILVADRQKMLAANPKADVRAQDQAISNQMAEIMKTSKAFGELISRRPSYPTD